MSVLDYIDSTYIQTTNCTRHNSVSFEFKTKDILLQSDPSDATHSTLYTQHLSLNKSSRTFHERKYSLTNGIIDMDNFNFEIFELDMESYRFLGI